MEFEHLWPGLIGVSKDFAPIVGTHRAFPQYTLLELRQASRGQQLSASTSLTRSPTDGVSSTSCCHRNGPSQSARDCSVCSANHWRLRSVMAQRSISSGLVTI